MFLLTYLVLAILNTTTLVSVSNIQPAASVSLYQPASNQLQVTGVEPQVTVSPQNASTIEIQ